MRGLGVGVERQTSWGKGKRKIGSRGMGGLEENKIKNSNNNK